MPQVRHLPLEVAEAAIHTANIPYRISRAQDQVVPEGDLISVAPAAAPPSFPGDEVRRPCRDPIGGQDGTVDLSCTTRSRTEMGRSFEIR